MMHLYLAPEHCRALTYCRDRFPKHALPEPIFATDQDEVTSWGVELVEGKDVAFFCVLGALITLISVLVGVLWAVLLHDVQSGFAVASFVATGSACLLGALQFALDQS